MRTHRNLVRVACAVVLAASLTGSLASAAPVPPPDFVIENAIPATTFTAPVSIDCAPGGRWFVAEKAGRVMVVENGVKKSAPFLDLRREVLSDEYHGLLGVLVDPNFATNRYVYVLYTVDPDSDGVDTGPNCFGRLTRYQAKATDLNVADPASRTILLGTSWATAPLVGYYHTINDFAWGSDGSLLVSIGDGAYSNFDAGGLYPNVFLPGRANPAEDIGVFRAQYLESLDGKILRIDPANGHGYPSNPFYDGNPTSVRSRIWAYGLKTPYRIAVRPLTGSSDTAAGDPGVVVIGEVGLDLWEEIDIATAGGRNFGWPCYEGMGPNAWYINASPTHQGCGTIGTPDNPSAVTAPVYAYHHTNPSLSVPPGFYGSCIIGGAFYTGSGYPSSWRGGYFFGDVDRNMIRFATFDAGHQLASVVDFATGATSPVDFAVDPMTKDVLYIAYATGEIRRIRYTGNLAVAPSERQATLLSEAFPNPTPTGAALTLVLPQGATAVWSVHDVLGHKLWGESRVLPTGRSTLAWPGTDWKGAPQRPGVYFVKVEAGRWSFTRRIVLEK